MSRRLNCALSGLLGLVILAGLWWGVSHTMAAVAQSLGPSGTPTPYRERPDVPNAPNISFIDSPTAECYMPVPHRDTCYINWNYLQVSASTSQYIISMTVAIDQRLRAYYSGFFQTSMYVPYDMQSPGFRVACGPPGAGGNPQWGNTYSYVIRARETGGLKAANYGSVTCPPDVVPVADVTLSGPLTGTVGVSYTFEALVGPLTVTLPITFSWVAADQVPVTVTNGLSSTQIFSWTEPGVRRITVGALNAAGVITAQHAITITAALPAGPPYKVYLPLVSAAG
jgi:hypothetical protein